MIAFTEIVGDEFGHRPAEMAFTERVMSENCVVTPDGCLRGTVVVIQHATDPLATANRSWADCSIKRLNQLVTDTLMVPLGMVVGDEFGYRATKMPLP